jgi:hypothetical protein
MYVRGRIALGFPGFFKPLFFYSTSEQNVRTTAHLCIQQASSPNSCHSLSRVCPSLPYCLGMRRPSPSDTPAGQGPKELPPHPRVMKNRPKRTAAATPWRFGCHPRAVDGVHHCTIHGVTYTDAAGILITGRGYSCHPPQATVAANHMRCCWEHTTAPAGILVPRGYGCHPLAIRLPPVGG